MWAKLFSAPVTVALLVAPFALSAWCGVPFLLFLVACVLPAVSFGGWVVLSDRATSAGGVAVGVLVFGGVFVFAVLFWTQHCVEILVP